MQTIGNTISRLRNSLNMSQRDFKKIKQSTIANIESHNRLPRLDTFLDLVSELNINLDEFMFILNGYAYDERTTIFKEIRAMRHSLYAKENKWLKDKLEKYVHENPDDIFIKDLKTIFDVLLKISKSNTYEIDSPESFDIYDRIEDCKVWTYEQIYTMSKLFYIFPEKRALDIIHRIIREFEKYTLYENIQGTKIAFLLNAGKYMIGKGWIDEAEPLLIEARDLSFEKDNLVTMSNANADLASILYIRGEIKKANEMIISAVTILEEGDKHILAEDIKKGWNLFLMDKVLDDLDF